ncbi:MAG: hypothetical protein WCJ07_12385, partial [Verrucomicrobiota bacterium]
ENNCCRDFAGGSHMLLEYDCGRPWAASAQNVIPNQPGRFWGTLEAMAKHLKQYSSEQLHKPKV